MNFFVQSGQRRTRLRFILRIMPDHCAGKLKFKTKVLASGNGDLSMHILCYPIKHIVAVVPLSNPFTLPTTIYNSGSHLQCTHISNVQLCTVLYVRVPTTYVVQGVEHITLMYSVQRVSKSKKKIERKTGR